VETEILDEMPKNYLFHWLLESQYLTFWQDALILCIIAMLLKLHVWMLLIHMTTMDCASLQHFSRSGNNASSYTKKPTLLL
jgi:hypothetical protein